MTARQIEVLGGGIVGLWQALVLAQRGHKVTLLEKTQPPFAQTASGMAGGMIAPFCEVESAEPLIEKLGEKALHLWCSAVACVRRRGTLVVASGRDRAELSRFARMTRRHRFLSPEALGACEPDLAGRFPAALLFEAEAHVDPVAARKALRARLQALSCVLKQDPEGFAARKSKGADFFIDCRGYDAAPVLAGLRGVRGEMLMVHSREVELSRPVRFLHPRLPVYVVPRGGGHFMVGASMVESADRRAITVRGALELLSALYGLHPGFAEAEITATGSGIRPAFADNLPKIIVRGSYILVNGLYRHGYLLAPVLAHMVADYIEAPDRSKAQAQAFFGRLVLEKAA